MGAAAGRRRSRSRLPAVKPSSPTAHRSVFATATSRDASEYSLSVFDGFNHLPNIEAVAAPQPGAITLVRSYPTMRSYGGDVAVPTPWFTVKGEAAYSSSDTPATDDYVLYVIQLERQSGEWNFFGGYAGEVVTTRRAVATFAPDRGLTRAIVARAGYTIDSNRSVAFEGAVRQNGDGLLLEGRVLAGARPALARHGQRRRHRRQPATTSRPVPIAILTSRSRFAIVSDVRDRSCCSRTTRAR